MISYTSERRKAALLIGISLLVMAIAAGAAYGGIHGSLVDLTHPEVTGQSLAAASGLFTLEIVLWFIIVATDLLVSWGVWAYFFNKSMKLALLSAASRLIYTLFLIVAVINLIPAASRASSQDIEGMMRHLELFEKIWSIGLIIFGVHLLFLSAVLCRYENKILGLLVTLAGISYVLVHTLLNTTPALHDFTSTLESILSLPMAAGELAFGLWLLIRGGKAKKASS